MPFSVRSYHRKGETMIRIIRNERDANLALAPIDRPSWQEPSPLPRRRMSMIQRIARWFA